ncbi:MAG: hypothetical protein NTX72_00340 [Candidatus Uhrbacteria bacterium]|nr:hypothetical protein [Candidatus Uhrbacteria bacterium]
MFKSIIVLVLFLSSSSIALAQAVVIPTEAQIAADKAACDKKYDPYTAPTSLKISIALSAADCKKDVDLKVLQLKAQVESLRSDKVEAALERVSKTAQALESAPKHVPPPAQATSTSPQEEMPPFWMGGAPFQTIDPPGSNAAATWDMFGGSPFRVEVYSINQGAVKWFGRSGLQRVVVKKNGQTLAVAYKGPPPSGVRFMDFYVDLDGDRKEDEMPVRGFDPSGPDSIYVGYQPGDTIELIFLVPIKTVAVMVAPGISRVETVWGNPKRLLFHENSVSHDQSGRPQISARTGDTTY